MVATLAFTGMRAEVFSDENVKVANNRDSIFLAGTLAIPDIRPKAAIVLATGSGIQNRDEEVFGHRPFKVIAEELASAGYAVLRMDDRGFAESEGADLLPESTVDDYEEDIYAGMEFMRSRFHDIPVGVIGHSEGGTIAIRIAANPEKECDFIVTLAAPAWSGDSIVMSQARQTATSLTGKWEGEHAERQILDIVKSSLPDYQKRAFMIQTIGQMLGGTFHLPAVQSSMMLQIDAMLTPYYVGMIRYDPASDIESVHVPWLALNGDKDVQVLPENLKTISALNPNAKTVIMASHNHLFQRAQTGMIQEYTQLTEDISPETITTIKEWLDNTLK